MHDAIRRLLGAPFVDGGRGPTSYDCWGLAMAAAACYGYTLPEFTVCCMDHVSKAGIAAAEATTGHWRRLDVPHPGCLAAFATQPGMPGAVTHVGIVVDGGRILHTMPGLGAVVIPPNHPYYRRKIIGYYQYAP